jgi:hypothetical protein
MCRYKNNKSKDSRDQQENEKEVLLKGIKDDLSHFFDNLLKHLYNSTNTEVEEETSEVDR